MSDLKKVEEKHIEAGCYCCGGESESEACDVVKLARALDEAKERLRWAGLSDSAKNANRILEEVAGDS